MKWQDAGYNCGPYAIVNALEAIGIIKSPEEVAALAGTTPQDGTDTPGMRKALEKLGRKPEVHYVTERAANVAWAVLLQALRSGRPCILAVDYDDKTDDAAHWVCARGLLGDRVLVADSAAPALEPSYNEGELLHRWNCKGRQAYCLIEV